jgi:hypothetical protein
LLDARTALDVTPRVHKFTKDLGATSNCRRLEADVKQVSY